jgi:hypothetical protein
MPAFLCFVIVDGRNVTLARNIAGLKELRGGLRRGGGEGELYLGAKSSWLTLASYMLWIRLLLSLLKARSKIYEACVRSEVFKAVTIKNGVFWDATPCDSCKNRRFGGT